MKTKYDLMYFVGDSWVYAIGQADDINQEVTKSNRFTDLVASYYDLPCINNSRAGAGNEYVCRTLYHDLYNFAFNEINPFVVMVYSDPWRREIYTEKTKSLEIISNATVSFHKEYFSNHYNYNVLCDLSIDLILQCRTLCDRFSFDFIDAFSFTSILNIPYYPNSKTLDERLDLTAKEDGRFYIPEIKNYGHANILGNRRIADKFIKKINDLYT